MSYLLVTCTNPNCKNTWNFYQEKSGDKMSTAVQILGMTCPNCGSIGTTFPPGSAAVPLQTETVISQRITESEHLVFNDEVPESTEGIVVTRSIPAGTELINVDVDSDLAFVAMKKESDRLLEMNKNRTVASDEDQQKVTEDLGVLASLKKKLTALQVKWNAPLKEHLNNINGKFTPILENLKMLDNGLRSALVNYQQEQKKRAAAIEEANRLRLQAAQIEAAANNGEITVPVIEIPVPPAPAKHVRTAVGTSTSTSNWTFEIIDVTLIPREYMIPDKVKIGKDIRGTQGRIKIAGVKAIEQPGIRITTPGA